MAITKGATITNIFNVDIDLTTSVALFITYEQVGRVVLEKDIDEATIESDKISIDLTQKETLKFRDDQPVYIQIRAKLEDNSAHVSNIIKTTASKVLKQGVI